MLTDHGVFVGCLCISEGLLTVSCVDWLSGCVSSHLREHSGLLLIPFVVHLRQSFEGLLNTFALHGTALEELEADLLRELLAIVRVDDLT